MRSDLDVLFLVAGEPGAVYQEFQAEHHTEPSAAARLSAAYCDRRGLGVAVIDGYIHELTPAEIAAGKTVFESVAQKVVDARPRLVAILVYGNEPSSSTMTMPSARKFAKAVRQLAPNIPLLLCGNHCAALPERTLREEPVDFVCDGEGPITTYELHEAIKAGAGLHAVRSLCYLDQSGAFIQNKAAPLLDLNEEPALPGWRFMDPRHYHYDSWHSRWRPYAERTNYANPFSMLGCPFHCDFCMTNAAFRQGESLDPRYRKTDGRAGSAPNSFRYLRPELFVAEVEYLVNTFGTRFFKIPDEMFAMDANHVAPIGQLLAERFGDQRKVPSSRRLSFWCYARIDTVHNKPAMHSAAAMGGIDHFGFGIEAGDASVRAGQDKKFTNSRIFEVRDQLRQAGIRAMLSNFIFGLPGDTRESMQATYDLACLLNPSFGNFYCTQALPGSALHHEALRSGYPLPERPGGPGWIGYAQYSPECEPYFVGSALHPQEILAFRDWAHVAFHTRPEFTQMLRDDPEYGEVAVATVDRWLAGIRNLKRKPRSEFPEYRAARPALVRIT